MSFQSVCALYDKLSNTSGAAGKKHILKGFITGWKRNEQDVYDLLRLLIPKYDGYSYQLKEDAIVSRLEKALMIDPKSQGGLRLKNWRNPVYSQNRQAVGDFPKVVYEEVRLRSNVIASTQTVKQTHDLLNQLSKSSGNTDKQIDAFKSMCMNYTAKEVMWLIRIIIKALHVGMTENSILDIYHPHAKHALDCGKDLRFIASQELKDVTTISLFSPLIPQRGLKGTPNSLKNFVKQTNNHFYIEEKIDGERLQLHYDRELDQIKWFTRNQIEETGRYGNRSTVFTKLSSKVVPGLNGKTLILDGEMVAYDPNSDTFLPFGTLKTAASNDINDTSQPHPCFIVFDVLWYNDHLIMNYKLEDRLKVLDKVVVNQGKHMFILPRIIGSNEDQVQEELATVISKRREGLVLKNPNLVYNLNSKDGAWLKIKPEYMDGMTENSDLIVVGAKYGTGRRSNKMAQFLVAVRDDRIPDTEDPKFVTYAMIGIGFKDDDLKELSQIVTSTVPYNRNNQPEWLSHPKRSNEEPDVIIDYRQSLVFEIKATQIVTAAHVGMAHSLRFPRFVRIRKDKSWKDCMTFKEVEEALSEGRVGQKRAVPRELAVQVSKKKLRTSYTLLESQLGFDSRTAEKKTSLFEGFKFCILSGNDQYTKEALEKMVTENGGGYQQSPTKADYVIAGAKVFRVKSLISKGSISLVYPQYIVDCIDEQVIVELAPKYMVFTNEALRSEFLLHMDIWGDSYTKNINDRGLKELFNSMKIDMASADDKYKATLSKEIIDRYFRSEIAGRIFNNVVLYCCSPKPTDDGLTMDWVLRKAKYEQLQLALMKLEFDGGQVVSAVTDEVTHVIVPDKDDSAHLKHLTNVFKRPPLPRFVIMEWIGECVKNNTLVDEQGYEPKLRSQDY